MTSWSYWLVVAGYVLAAGGLAVAVGAGRRLLALAGVGVIGAVCLFPVSCRSFIMPMCVPGSPGECDPSADMCTTLVGLRVPYVDALGVPAAQAVSIVVILAGLAAGVAAGWLQRRARSSKPTVAVAQAGRRRPPPQESGRTP